MNREIEIESLIHPPEETLFSLFHKHYCSENVPQVAQRDNLMPWEADTYRYEFNLGLFFKSLLVFLVDIIGLKVFLILYGLISGSKFITNLRKLGRINFWIDVFGWINILLIIYSIYQKTWIYTDAQILGYMIGLFFLAIAGASEMSFVSRKIPPLLETTELSKESLDRAGSFNEKVKIEDQMKRTILRLNFDSSSFFMSFLEKSGNEKFKTDLFPASQAIKDQGDKLVWAQPVCKADLIAKATKFEYAVFDDRFLTKASRYDKEKAYGYKYAEQILKESEPELKYPYGWFLITVGVIGIIIVSYMKFDASDKSSDDSIVGYTVKGTLLVLNALVTAGVLYYITKGTHTIWSRLCYVKGLAELISLEEPLEDTLFRKKDCSMLNVFDFESLRTWASLRMVFMNLKQRRLEAISLATSLIVSIQILSIVFLGFFYFTAESPHSKDLFLKYIIFFGAPTVIYMIFVLLFIYLGAQVNNQYQEHITLLRCLKIEIYKLFVLYPDFTGQEAIKASTYFYTRSLKYLQGLGFMDQKERRNEKLEEIEKAYDTIIAELEIEEQNRPLKLLGIPMTDSFAGTVFGTIFTVVMVPISKYVTQITGWE